MSTRLRISTFLLVVAAFALAGCTPDDQQTSQDNLNMAAQDAIAMALDFAISFGRQALAAYLF